MTSPILQLHDNPNRNHSSHKNRAKTLRIPILVFSAGSPKETRRPTRVCTFADTACAARFLSTSGAPSITFYFPATCSRVAGTRFTGVCAGLWTLSGILQSRSEDRCNPRASPFPPVQKCPKSRIPHVSRPKFAVPDRSRVTNIDVATWPLRCSPIAVLVSSKRLRPKSRRAFPASASAHIVRLEHALEIWQ